MRLLAAVALLAFGACAGDPNQPDPADHCDMSPSPGGRHLLQGEGLPVAEIDRTNELLAALDAAPPKSAFKAERIFAGIPRGNRGVVLLAFLEGPCAIATAEMASETLFDLLIGD
jgi:hypothetical protein